MEVTIEALKIVTRFIPRLIRVALRTLINAK